MSDTNWKKEITTAMEKHSETWNDVVYFCIAKHHSRYEEELEASDLVPPEDLEKALLRTFDGGLGGNEGFAFTLWTHKRVYFPVDYDGAEWAESVPRDPCDEMTQHIGGGG